MNEQQAKFLKTMENTLDSFLKENRLPDDWDSAVGFIDVVVTVCKGHKDEAREILWGITTKWEKKQNEDR